MSMQPATKNGLTGTHRKIQILTLAQKTTAKRSWLQNWAVRSSAQKPTLITVWLIIMPHILLLGWRHYRRIISLLFTQARRQAKQLTIFVIKGEGNKEKRITSHHLAYLFLSPIITLLEWYAYRAGIIFPSLSFWLAKKLFNYVVWKSLLLSVT